jgi:CHAD domain-containing protein
MGAYELITSDSPLEDAQRALRGWFTVKVGAAADVDRTYYDTFDGLLYEAGLTLSVQGGIRTLGARDGSPLARALSAEGVAGVRALLPIADVKLSAQVVDVLDERDKTVCRIVLEAPSGLRRRALLVGLRGYEAELSRVSELLVADVGFEVAGAPLVDEAVLARGGDPAGTSAKVDVPLAPELRADEAVVRVLTRLLEILDANLPGTLADLDSEFLHDYRVAIRRTRAVLRELRGVFPAVRLADLRLEFKWLQEVTGPTRDLDVYLLEFERLRALAPAAVQPDLDPLLAVLRSWHVAAREQMERDLVSDRARRLHDGWATELAALTGLPEQERPDAVRPILDVAGERIWKLHRRMVKMGRSITADSEPEEYHELRKQGKELRYLLELFAAPLYDVNVVRPLIRALKGLQDVLGVHQDRDVQVTTLKRLGEQVAAQPGGAAALMAMGALLDRLEAEAHDARGHFAESFAEFASDAQCKLVDETFKPAGP